MCTYCDKIGQHVQDCWYCQSDIRKGNYVHINFVSKDEMPSTSYDDDNT